MEALKKRIFYLVSLCTGQKMFQDESSQRYDRRAESSDRPTSSAERRLSRPANPYGTNSNSFVKFEVSSVLNWMKNP